VRSEERGDSTEGDNPSALSTTSLARDGSDKGIRASLSRLRGERFSPLDLLPQSTLAEKLVALVLDGPPACPVPSLLSALNEARAYLARFPAEQLHVVVLGGGTGLSSLVGGDSRQPNWPDHPFGGLKELFPRTHAVVCVTDDGGSTGELQKDLPLAALGDLRHVLLSSVQQPLLRSRYKLDSSSARQVLRTLHQLFNYRFTQQPGSPLELLATAGEGLEELPSELLEELRRLIARLFVDARLRPTLDRPHCLGNLLLASAIYGELDPDLAPDDLVAQPQVVRTATIRGLMALAAIIGAPAHGVLPCTTSPARLQILYSDGVMVTGEHKSSLAHRRAPVDRVRVEFACEPFVPCEVLDLVARADLLILAPGSLYSSIIPVLQVPGLASAIRANTRAMKLLVANIWVQRGETDVARAAPERKFHVSDLLAAYDRNIPGGLSGLCSHVLALGLRNIPGSILQRYALENKEPIYCDRDTVEGMGYRLVEAGIFSSELLQRRHVIQHDPRALALAVRTLAAVIPLETAPPTEAVPIPAPTLPDEGERQEATYVRGDRLLPCQRYQHLNLCLRTIGYRLQGAGPHTAEDLPVAEQRELAARLSEILWHHQDIPSAHLANVRGLMLVDPAAWNRCQRWDQVFSFYDPLDGWLKVRADQLQQEQGFETAVLVALGQSILGNYALNKTMEDIRRHDELVGRMFHLELRLPDFSNCLLSPRGLDLFLRLSRMRPSSTASLCYTRLVNGSEGFTPPGLLFGLLYVWYLDNRQASHIEYKMSIMRMSGSRLIPEQTRTSARRQRLVSFFREEVFGQQVPRTIAVDNEEGHE